jgi:hypothetical protein
MPVTVCTTNEQFGALKQPSTHALFCKPTTIVRSYSPRSLRVALSAAILALLIEPALHSGHQMPVMIRSVLALNQQKDSESTHQQ